MRLYACRSMYVLVLFTWSSLSAKLHYYSIWGSRNDLTANQSFMFPNVLVSLWLSLCCVCRGCTHRLRETLPKFAAPGTTLYIATNEEDPHFFDALKELYTVFIMDDFQRLWGPGSAWLAAYQGIFNMPEPELDVYMRVSRQRTS